MNKVILLGRLTKDSELRTTNGGVSCCRFTVAVNRKYKNQQTGEYDADFISCVAWRQTAEFICRYFGKGQMIALEGTLRTDSYQDKKYPDITHYTTEVYVDNVEFAGFKTENNGSNGAGNSGNGNYTSPPPQTAQNAVQAAQSANINTQQQTQYMDILSDGDVPF